MWGRAHEHSVSIILVCLSRCRKNTCGFQKECDAARVVYNSWGSKGCAVGAHCGVCDYAYCRGFTIYKLSGSVRQSQGFIFYSRGYNPTKVILRREGALEGEGKSLASQSSVSFFLLLSHSHTATFLSVFEREGRGIPYAHQACSSRRFGKPCIGGMEQEKSWGL